MSERAGEFLLQSGGYRAFIPAPLPPDPPIQYTPELLLLLSDADRALARLDGIASVLPNRDLFIAMYVKKEALLSSQIEGTQASLEGVLEFEAHLKPEENIDDIQEVVNYVRALNYGIKRLHELPMSLRLIKEVHQVLMEGVRGQHRRPGEFRHEQNFIGPLGGAIQEATFIPPPPDRVEGLMGEWERFLHADDSIPPLVRIGLIHAQFETIHPFMDGNGRTGRLLITLYLAWKGILTHPLLYLSLYLKARRTAYYDALDRVRKEGGWESWLTFFLEGIRQTSQAAGQTAQEIIALKEDLIQKLSQRPEPTLTVIRLVDLLFTKPVIGTSQAAEHLKVTPRHAGQLLRQFAEEGIVREITGKQRHKRYLFKSFVEILSRGTQVG
jgi:Fic family protein